MSAPTNCCSNCGTVLTTSIPGIQGQSAFTDLTAGFVVPALGGQIQVSVVNSDWAAVGESVFIPGAGVFEIISIPSPTLLLLEYSNISSNVDAGAAIVSGVIVTPSAVPGADGTNGTNAFTVTTADFVIPAVNANVSNPDGFIHVASTAFMGVGQVLFISDGTDVGSFEVVSITDATSFVAKFLGYALDSAPGVTIGSGATTSPGGTEPVLAAPLPTAFTDNSTGTASDTIAAGVGIYTLTIPLTSLATGLSTAAIDLLTNLVPGYRFKLLSFSFVTTIVGAGAGASQIFNLEIGATDTTGGVLTVTLASTNTIGAITAATAITAANVGSAADTLSVEMAAGGTAFTSGSGYFVIRVQNMDSADAIASLAEHVDDLIASLT